jgi:hypothetical protein
MIVSVMTEITSQNLTPRCKHMPGQLRSLPISCGFRLVGEGEVHTGMAGITKMNTACDNGRNTVNFI